MKKAILAIAIILVLGLTACGGRSDESASAENESSQSSQAQEDSSTESSDEETGRKVASDGAQMQTDDPSMPTRIIENGTRIKMYFGDTVIPGILNDCETAQALIENLPYTVSMSRYSHDFCGVTDELPYNEDEVHYGWLNGDIDYSIRTNILNLTVFFILHSSLPYF